MTFVNPAYPLATPPYIGPTSYLLPNDTLPGAYDSSYLSPRYDDADFPEYERYRGYGNRYDDYRYKNEERRKDIFGLPVLGGDEKGDGGFGMGSGLIGLLIGKLLPALLGGGKDGKEGGGLLGGLLG